MMKKTLLIALALVLALGMTTGAVAQEEMTYEEYEAQLANWQQREQDAQAQIDQLEQEIADLQSQIEAMDQEIANQWQQIYDMLGVTESDLTMYADKLDQLGSDLDAFGRLSPEEMYQRSEELDAMAARLDKMDMLAPSLLTKYMNIISDLRSQIESLRGRMAKPKVKMYTVVRGDYLWKIAKMPDHYGDGTKWMRIYSVNHEQINDPDLIYPDQKFSIPLDIDKKSQYLVKRGEHLSSIAESLWNDPFKWRKLYDANQGLIDDPNMVYPETILEVPGR